MDAPPGKEDVRPFLRVREWMAAAGVRVPRCIAAEPAEGFVLLEDFGDVTWAACLRGGGDVDALMDDALAQLSRIQRAAPAPALPVFGVSRMRDECDLFLDWFLPHVAGHAPSAGEREAFHAALSPMLNRLAALPRVPVHLDFHSRNLMLPPDAQGRPGLPLGVIDFQDAVMGPVTYDVASLLYDCYQDYPETWRRQWSERFPDMLPPAARAAFDDADDWHAMVRLTACQRHIKAIGIFARLAFRDGKRRFLDEIPLTARHLRDEMEVLGVPEGAARLLRMATTVIPG